MRLSGDVMKTQPEIANGIDARIVLVRGHKAILDRDLAELYGVPVRSLNQAVTRNLDRFPEDFMIQLGWEEMESLRSQIVIIDKGPERGRRRGMHLKYPPRAFTEQGVAMLSSVLRSKRAIQVNVEIMRAFVRMRQILAAHADLARKLDALEKRYDAQFKVVFDAIRQLMTPPSTPKHSKIGFGRE